MLAEHKQQAIDIALPPPPWWRQGANVLTWA